MPDDDTSLNSTGGTPPQPSVSATGNPSPAAPAPPPPPPPSYETAKQLVLSPNDSGPMDNANQFGFSQTKQIEMLGIDDMVGTKLLQVQPKGRGITDTVMAARGTSLTQFDPTGAVAGDRIYRRFFGGWTGTRWAHVGNDQWAVDMTPTHGAAEIASRWSLVTSTGDLDTMSPANNRVAIAANYLQKCFVAGPRSNMPNLGTDFGGNLLIGIGGPEAGGAAIKFLLPASNPLMPAPEPGAYEVTDTGVHFVTDNAAKPVRRQVVMGDLSAPIATVLPAAGTGATCTVTPIGPDAFNVALTLGAAPGASATSLVRVAFAHPYPNSASATFSARDGRSCTWMPFLFVSNDTNAGFDLVAPGAPMIAGETYSFAVHVRGR